MIVTHNISRPASRRLTIQSTSCVKRLASCFFIACQLAMMASTVSAQAPSLTPSKAPSKAHSEDIQTQEQVLEEFCSRCHNDERMSGDWSLSDVDIRDVQEGRNLSEWEKILRMTQIGEMPPPHRPQPTPETKATFTGWLEKALDDHAAAHPNPGRATLRRLNRVEYSNAVRDLLAIDIDLQDELPSDDTGYGFDNIADVLSVSPTLMDRYLAVAGKVSRLATGLGPDSPTLSSYTVPKDGSILNQGVPSYNTRSSDMLPIDSRGGGAFDYYAPYDATYEIGGYLNANTNNEVDRLEENHYSIRVPLTAGPHSIGMSFRKQLALDESVQTLRNTTSIVVMPTEAATLIPLDFVVDGARVATKMVPSYFMSERFSQVNFLRDVMQIDVQGPFDIQAPGSTPSREKIFSCTPSTFWGSEQRSEKRCAKKILSSLAKQAYRRPVTNTDIEPLLHIFNGARLDGSFEESIATSIQALLVSPSFLFLVEHAPSHAEPNSIQPISDLEFASRLALFLWSSLPDEQLIKLASKNKLRKPKILAEQIDRMLSDPKAKALTHNFAGQWLYLRNLQHQRPDVFVYPEFDTPLRQAMQRETELFFSSIVRDNQSILDFISSDYTYLNERLADHYDIPNVKGSAFRKVDLAPEFKRGGLLGHASVLTVTSYGNHTSAVKRGKWILENLLAATPPPPPPDIPALKLEDSGRALSAREQMALHRADPACASCHVKMDPLGLSLEQYDAVGGFRSEDSVGLIDASATMPNGQEFTGLPGLQNILLDRKTEFASAFIQRMLTYALGRGLEAYDLPKVRTISRAAAADNYKVRAIIQGIVTSEPFNLRRTSTL